MKWGKKKHSSSSLPRTGSLSSVFPISWLSRFKKMGGNSEAMPEKGKRKGHQNLPSRSSAQPASCKNGRFYGREDEAFWRLSFGEESAEGRKSNGRMKSVRYDSDKELAIPPSSCQSCGSSTTKLASTKENKKFSKMVSDIKKMRELNGNVEVLQKNDKCKGGKESKETEFKVPKEVVKDGTSRKTNRIEMSELERKSDRAKLKPLRSVEEDILKSEQVLTIRTTERDTGKLKASGSRRDPYVSTMKTRNLGTISEDDAYAAAHVKETDTVLAEKFSTEWQTLKEAKIKELVSKSRKSFYISREIQSRRTRRSSRVRVHSPRTPSKVETCRIKAIEDIKRTKMEKKKIKERMALENFAVVKCSLDPQQDFRDSMVEMIMEKRITRPEELEELLVCYLTLNSNEHHNLIIKVFRQVWFDFNATWFDCELQNEHCCHN